LLRFLQHRLALARELHTALELRKRLLERELAALEPLDERLQLRERFLELTEVRFRRRHRSGCPEEAATVHTAGETVKPSPRTEFSGGTVSTGRTVCELTRVRSAH